MKCENNSMKLLLLSCLLILSTQVSADIDYSSLEIKKETDSDSFYKAVYIEDNAGSVSNPDIVYVPFSKAGQLSVSSSYLGSETGYLPDFANLEFRFTITASQTEYYAVAVRQDGSTTNYNVIYGSTSTLSSGTSTTVTFNDGELCTQMGGSTCTGLQSSTNDESVNFHIAVIGSDAPLTAGTDITMSSYEDRGQVINLKMSSKVETNSPTITTTLVGDENLEINFTSPIYTNFGNLKKTLVITQGSASATSTTIQAATAVLDTTRTLGSVSTGVDEVEAKTSGAVRLRGLVNEYQYNVSVVLVNEYQLATYVSPTISGTPLNIETFLQAQNCYLISAGFGKDHYVLQYFRSFRDKYLLKSGWGTKFVEAYYETAPQYARYIYENEWMRGMVRAIAYVSYTVFNFPIPILLGLLTLFGLRKVIKIPIK